MIDKVSRSDIADLRSVLVDANYNEETLTRNLGSAQPPAPGQVQSFMRLTRDINAANALVRLFLGGMSLDRSSIDEVLPKLFIDMAIESGILAEQAGRVSASIVIVPVGKMLFASDAFRKLGGPDSSDFVLPARTYATDYLRHMTVRDPVAETVDLGCGCGVHALLASSHSDAVIATDISESAVAYTRFNAELNDIRNVEARVGKMFEPLESRRFDLIVSNPPFIIGPNSDLTYRDNPLDLDDFCRYLVREAPSHLKEGGRLQMLCEWVETSKQTGRERVVDWVEGLGCDAWALRANAQAPRDYVAKRMADVSGPDVTTSTGFDEWLEYLDTRDVRAIHSGMLVLRRRDGNNWFHMLSSTFEPRENLGTAVSTSMSTCDFLELCDEDESLLDATIKIADNAELVQRFSRDGDAWKSRHNVVKLTQGLPLETEIDLPILAFLNQVDGKRTLRESIDRFCKLTAADSSQLSRELLPAVRMLIGNGVLAPADLDG